MNKNQKKSWKPLLNTVLTVMDYTTLIVSIFALTPMAGVFKLGKFYKVSRILYTASRILRRSGGR